MRNWGQVAAIRAAGNGSLGARVLVREVLLVHLVQHGGVGAWAGGVLYRLYEARYLPLQLVRLLLNPLSILLFIEAQCLFLLQQRWTFSSGRPPPRSSSIDQTTIHHRPARMVCRRVQRPALRPPGSLASSRLGLGGRLPNLVYPAGCAGTAAQRPACSVELADLGCLDCRAENDMFDRIAERSGAHK